MADPLSLFKKFWHDFKARRAHRKLIEAIDTVNKFGFRVFRFEEVGGSQYLIDSKGTRHRIGRK